MELVPILSTIILVGTIATFILAVAAYILYKIRERKTREAPERSTAERQEQHVLVQPQVIAGQPAPASIYAPASQVTIEQPEQRPAARIPAAATAVPPASMFWEYTDEGFVPVSPQRSAPAAPRQETRREDDQGYAWL